MNSNKSESSITLVDAVETLSSIAEMDVNQEVGIAKTHHFIMQDEEFNYRTIHWLHRNNTNETVGFVQEIFKVVLNYLKNFYHNEYTLVTDNKTLDGIKTIMVLVGEAAKKIDKYTHLFHKEKSSVTDLKEYKQLQDFYFHKISRTIDEGVLGKWILALSEKTWSHRKIKLEGPKKFSTKHVFVEFESVKKDTDYELFILRKEDGSRFFNPRIVRNIKLICDFGNYFGHEKDPLLDIEIWKDRQAFESAQCVLKSIQSELMQFYQDLTLKEQEFARQVNKIIMALMLAGNSKNLAANQSVKSCYEYFKDFQLFLRQALVSSAYQKSCIYLNEPNLVVDVVNAMCKALFTMNTSLQDLKGFINYTLDDAYASQSEEHLVAAKKSGLLWNRLASDYAAMQKLFRRHPNGALTNVLKMLEEESSCNHFDALCQENYPNTSYAIVVDNLKLTNLRLPSPTKQEFIHKADIIPEFKGFLRANKADKKKHLLFNLQDRTSWKEHARSQALEELGHLEFANEIAITTMPKDTDFYYQLSPYHEEHQTGFFIEHLKGQLLEDQTGFFIPENVKKVIAGEWLEQMIDVIHKEFFYSKNVLTKEARLDFIELLYFFIELKVLDEIMPDTFSFTCKDSIDTGTFASTELFCLLSLFSNRTLTSEDLRKINVMIYGPAIINRERLPKQDRFNRFLSVLKLVESTKEKQKQIFASLFTHNWFQCELSLNTF